MFALPKYELSKTETMEHKGHTLRRIYYDLINGQKYRGGWIESEENMRPSMGGAVYDEAKVYGFATVELGGDVTGDADISGLVQISGYARVYQNAVIEGGKALGRMIRINQPVRIRSFALIKSHIPMTTRSDGYAFTIYPNVNGSHNITAGCRVFSVMEAIDHWITHERKSEDRPLYDETLRILCYLLDTVKDYEGYTRLRGAIRNV